MSGDSPRAPEVTVQGPPDGWKAVLPGCGFPLPPVPQRLTDLYDLYAMMLTPAVAVMANYDGGPEIDEAVAAVLRLGDLWAVHYGRGFAGRVWHDDGSWREQVWVRRRPVKTFGAVSLEHLLEAVNNEFGWGVSVAEQSGPFVIRLMHPPSGKPAPFVGQYLVEYDPHEAWNVPRRAADAGAHRVHARRHQGQTVRHHR